jgi:hypothetical protein
MRKITDDLGIDEKIIHQENGRISIDPTMPEEKKGNLVLTNRRILFFVDGAEGPSKVLDITRRSVEGFRTTMEGSKALMQLKTPSIIASLSAVTFGTIEGELKSDLIAEGKVLVATRSVEIDFNQEVDGRHAIIYNDEMLGYVEIPPYFSTMFVDAKFYSPDGEPAGGIIHGQRWMSTNLIDKDGKVFGKIDYPSQRSMRISKSTGHPLALVAITMKDSEYELLFIHPKDHTPLAGAIMRTSNEGLANLDLKFYEYEDDPKYIIFSSIAIKRYLEERE